MLHAPGTNHTNLLKIAEYFEKREYSTISPDLRGHGKSEYGDFQINSFSKDIHSVLKKEDIKSVSIIACCASGNLALFIADNSTNLIEKLILLNLPNRLNLTLKCRFYNIIIHISKPLILSKLKKSKKNKTFDYSASIVNTEKQHINNISKSMKFSYYLIVLDSFINYKIMSSGYGEKIFLFNYDIGVIKKGYDFPALSHFCAIINFPKPKLNHVLFDDSFLNKLEKCFQ